MRIQKAFTSVIVLVMALNVLAVPAAAQSPTNTRQVPSSGTAVFQSLPDGSDPVGIQSPEFANSAGDVGGQPFTGSIVNRSNSKGHANGASAKSGTKAKSNPELNLSFDALNFRQQRLANGGNQFSVEPPDQALCAGNGYVLEAVNDVLRVFDSSGSPVTGVVDLNTFYGYAPAINRSTRSFGPELTDPVCVFDSDTGRFFLTVLTLDRVGTTSELSLVNHLDLAVSQTSNPTGAWKIYKVDVTDDGTNDTPVHTDCPCLGDYPHIGLDANGLYLTTNEYPWLTNGFNGAQVYTFSKRQLASGAASVGVTQIDTNGMAGGNPGFTVWPAVSPAGQFNLDNGGTEFFLSSDAAEEANNLTGSSTRIWRWALTNTASLDTTPAVSLSTQAVSVLKYGIPPKSEQKAGDYPQGQCLNIPSCATAILLGVPDPFAPEPISHLDSNDTRMQQVIYANGKLWGALDTALTLNGVNKAGIEYFVINPNPVKVVKNGYLGLANNNLNYPAVGVTSSGRGVIAFTVVGNDYHPSAGYASLDALVGAGPIHIAALGVGVDDGFTGYAGQVGDPPRTRWGDYGAAVMDGNSIWIASEYINQTCTLAQYLSAPIGSCGGTRTALGNWSTRISKVTP